MLFAGKKLAVVRGKICGGSVQIEKQHMVIIAYKIGFVNTFFEKTFFRNCLRILIFAMFYAKNTIEIFIEMI